METDKNSADDDGPELQPEHNFYCYFGTVLSDICIFFRHQIPWYHRLQCFLSKNPSLPPYFEKANVTIEKHILEWKTLKTYSDGAICYHVYKTFYMMLKDPDFYALSSYERNVILWSVLLHDICKRGSPIWEGKDAIHPFKSAWLTLYYFNHPFKFVELTSEDLKEWNEIFEKGYVESDQYKMKQNHGIVRKVKQFLDEKLKDKKFEREVLYNILLHQSIPIFKDFPQASYLDPLETELPMYFNQRTFRTYRMFVKYDSFSYILYSRKLQLHYGEEMKLNMDKFQNYV